MAGKKKNKSAITPKRKGKNSKAKAKSAPRKAPAKKAKTVDIVLPVLNAAKLKELYATMVKCRMLAERVQNSQHKEAHNISGLEATLVGAGAHLRPQDCIALEHGSFLASLIKGTSPRSIVARLNQPLNQTKNGTGNPTPSMRGAGVAVTPSMATGLALAQELKGKGTVTLMFGTHEPGASAFEPAAMAL